MRNKMSRKTLFDELGGGTNIYCRRADLGNDASVEYRFVSRLLRDLGYKDSQIKTKESLQTIAVSRGGRKTERYKPDYALMIRGRPRCIVDAKAVTEEIGR